MLSVSVPPTYPAERRYICDVLLGEFLGLPYRVETADRADTAIALDGRELTIADGLFATPPGQWLTPASLPARPLIWWARPEGDLPVLYGRPGESEGRLELDIFGSAFFMLTRYEEVVLPDRDDRGRFPATASLAWQEGFLDRPVVNEYLELLWQALKRLWPGLVRKPRIARTLLSHDVDDPLCTAGRSIANVLKSTAGDLVKRRSPALAVRRAQSAVATRRGDLDGDICNTFGFIMELSEQRGLRSAFNFITDHTAGAVDGVYSIDAPWIRRLMRRVDERGHEIGLHPSYNSCRDPAQIRREFDLLRRAAAEEGIAQAEWGGRQHYLRWEAPATWQAWADAGLAYDSTLTFADRAGFRCGVCYEYPVFNLHTRQPLSLRERPLIVMECTLLEYMGLTPDEAGAEIRRLRDQCRRFDGDLTLLWHNCRLIHRPESELYRSLVAEL